MTAALRSPWSSIDGVEPLPQSIEGDVMSNFEEAVLGEIGFDWGSLINAAGNVAKTGVEQKQASDAANKDKKDSADAVAKSISADANWSNTEANLELAAADSTRADAARIVRDSAKADAMAAGAALKGDGINKRCKAAHDALNNAASALSADPKNIAKQAKMHAWKTVSDACGSPSTDLATDDHGGGGGGGGHHAAEAESWFTAKHAGLPGWGWGLVGVGGLAALVLIIRSMRKA